MSTQEERDELMNAEVPHELVERFMDLIEQFPSTTRFLVCLADWLATDAEDDRGAELLEDFLEKFADYEVETL